MIDLNDLIVGDPGMVIFEAYYINDAGDIAATGLLPNGNVHAILLKHTSATGAVNHGTSAAKPALRNTMFGHRLHEVDAIH